MSSPVNRIINPDLQRERNNCTFNIKELTLYLDGGIDKYKQRINTEEFFFSDTDLQEKIPLEYLSHEDKYKETMRIFNVLVTKLKKNNVTSDDPRAYENMSPRVFNALFRDGNPTVLTNIIFIPMILSQGDEEQQKYWLPKAKSMNIIGTYAQTELGHGTFIRGIETTATYIRETEEFELNTPSISAYKWWPGGMAHTANYAVLLAQLYTNGKCYGVHPFMVQLRNTQTHEPMPGITIGEIGPKFGYNSNNNGFLGLKSVRIPRRYMLMKNSQVLTDGTYVKSSAANDKIVYLGMMFIRVGMIEQMSLYTSKATTIAIRYSAVRRQSQLNSSEREAQILDFQTQQYKLIPAIASAYAMKFGSNYLRKIFDEILTDLQNGGSASLLPELHAIGSCMKAVCTSDAARWVEIARLACGGHGYLSSSGLPLIFPLAAAACTYEGENTVMLLQTARALMKAWTQVMKNTPVTPTFAYLRSYEANKNIPWKSSLEGLVRGFQLVAAGKIATCHSVIRKHISNGLSPELAWNETLILLTEAAEAHCRAFLMDRYFEAIQKDMNEMSPELRAVMKQLCMLYSVYWALLKSGDFITYANLKPEDRAELYDIQGKLLAQLRSNAVGLVDAFDFRDEVLGSTLGAFDGQVYERLYESAMQSPMNQKLVHDSFKSNLGPILKSKY